MFSVADAKRAMLDAVHPLAPRALPLAEALGCVLAEDVTAAIALPSWDNSAMDGYAVRASDIASASENNPIHLRVLSVIAAGTAATIPLEPQTCARIFTGAPGPPGADAVVMQEDTRPHHEGYIAAVEAVEQGENIRRIGEDVEASSVVLRAGATLGPAQLGIAAAVGVAQLAVHPTPRIGVLCTGAELIEAGQLLRAGQIYNSNGVTVAALIERAGCVPIDLGIADDTREDLQEKLDYAFSECDAVVTVGGVSVGEYDLVKEVLVELGCEQKFWQVAMKPGKPFLFGTRGERLIFGLPGNPVSSFVTFLVLVRPALLRLRGLTNIELPTMAFEAAEDFVNRGDRAHYMRARIENGKITPLPQQGSHMLSSIAHADALVEVPACQTFPRGSSVTALLLG